MKLTAEEVKEPAQVSEAPLAENKNSAAPEESTVNSPGIAAGAATMNQPSTTPLDSDLFIDQGAKKSSKKSLFLVVILVALAVALVSGGIMVYRRTMDAQTPIDSQPETNGGATAPTPVAEVTPAPELDRGELKIQVLNGSGTPGFAGKAETYLEELGYVEVATGNADSYDFDETVIAIKEDKEEYLDMLKADLVEKYVVAAKTETLEEDSQYDVVITLGSDEATTEEDEVTPTPSAKAVKSPTPSVKAEKSPTPAP